MEVSWIRSYHGKGNVHSRENLSRLLGNAVGDESKDSLGPEKEREGWILSWD